MANIDNNFLLINKPAGWTSFDVVNFIRNQARAATGNKKIKVGHAGTLDPFATGLLIVGVGREATKRLDEFKSLPKTYVATIRLGATSDTGDATGRILDFRFKILDSPVANSQNLKSKIINLKLSSPTPQKVKDTLNSFAGKQSQTPPMFSAKKINGTRLYKLARQGIEVKRQPIKIEIFDIKLLKYSWPRLKIEVSCSAGTYIRTLAQDIGEKLRVGAYCEALERTKIGSYTLAGAVSIEHIDKI